MVMLNLLDCIMNRLTVHGGRWMHIDIYLHQIVGVLIDCVKLQIRILNVKYDYKSGFLAK